jgi:hypothetical protein
MKRKILVMSLLSIAGAVVFAQSITGYPFTSNAAVHVLRDSVRTKEGAYLMLPPEPALSDVESFAWNPEGTRLVALTRPRDGEAKSALENLPQPAVELSDGRAALVDAKSLQLTWITGVEIGNRPAWVEWPAGMNFCILGMAWNKEDNAKENFRHSYHVIDPTTGKAELLAEGEAKSLVINLDPIGPGRVLMTTFKMGGPKWERKTSVIDAQGHVGPSLPGLPEAYEQDWAFLEWSKKFGLVLTRNEQEFAVLFPSGDLQPLDKAALEDDRKTRDLNAAIEAGITIDERPATQGKELWLVARPDQGVQPAAMVCSTTEISALSPKKNGVAYTSQGMLWLRRLVMIDNSKYDALRLEAVKKDAMDVAKKVGTAVNMYSQDYDDTFPTGDFGDILGPYAKDPGIFGRFTFQMPGGSSNVPDPAKTALGFVQTDSGRATVYADGHVEWKDRQP